MAGNRHSAPLVGIVGAGLMGKWHAVTALKLGCSVAGVVDCELPNASRLCRQLGIGDLAFDSLQALQEKRHLDIVHVCTPARSHFDVAMEAFEAGSNVIVEKPLGSTEEETSQLLLTAKERGLKICPVHQFGFQQGVLHVIKRLQTMGDLLCARFMTGSAGGENNKLQALDGIVADILPHPLSVLQRICPGVSMDPANFNGLRTRDGELQFLGALDGVCLAVYVSMNARPTRCEMELFFENGRVLLNFFHGYAVFEKGPISRIQKIVQPFKFSVKEFCVAGFNLVKRSISNEFAYPGLKQLIARFYSAISTGKPSPISDKEILDIARVRDGLTKRFHTSRQEGKMSNA